VIHAWTISTSLNPPTTAEIGATCTWASDTLACVFLKALAAKTSYGLAIPGSGAVAGLWAPVTMKTRMNNAVNAGPVMDNNVVFDVIGTDAVAPTFTLAATKVTASGATEKKYPGETATFTWTITQAWTETNDPLIKSPW